MSTIRRLTRIALTALIGLAFFHNATAQSSAYPNRPIRLVVPTAAGGMYDTLSRLLGERVSEALGQTVVIENMPGGNMMISIRAVANARPDGYTLLLGPTGLVVNPLLDAKIDYDAFKAFVPICRIGSVAAFFVIAPDLPARSMPELIAHIKSTSTSLSYGSQGIGSTSHLYGEMFSKVAGIPSIHVPYKGETPMLIDLTTSRVKAGFVSGMAAYQYAKEGKLKVVGTPTKKRTALMPEVPTFAEQGFDGIGADSWVGVFAPAGTPKAIIDKVAGAFDAAIKQPAMQERMTSYGMEPGGGTADEFAAVMRRSQEEWSSIIKRTNIKIE